MTSARRVIINADDLGLSRGVNRGIMEALAAHAVRSASLMVNLPASEDAARRLAERPARAADVGIGLHFNVVTGEPLTDAPSLCDSRTGRFLPLQAQAWRAWRGRVAPKEIAAELDAQLERATRLLEPAGLRVTHLDSHRHVHCLPGFAAVVLEAARRHAIPHVRHSTESVDTLLGRPVARLKARALRFALGGVPQLDAVRFAGIALMASPTFEADLHALLASLPAGDTEVMVHPGYDSPELAALDSYRTPRERELRALTAPALLEKMTTLAVTPCHFGAPATSPPA